MSLLPKSNKTKPLLSVENLNTFFFTTRGVVKAVNNVSFTLKAGETLGVLGESGSGKSVMALSILRLVQGPAGKIVGGKIFLDGRDLLKISKGQMREYRGKIISMILQDPLTSLNPVFTIGKQVAESVRIHRFGEGAIRDQIFD